MDKKYFTFFSLLIMNCSLLVAKEPFRLTNGRPLEQYWQQRVDYALSAELLPDSNLLVGKGTITYYNNSPDTLSSLVWHLYQNVFLKDSSPRKNDEQSTRAFGVTKGITAEKIVIDSVDIVPTIDETIMETVLPKPLLPHSKIEIAVEWNYDIPRTSYLRTGREGDDFGICQWYPQIAVYDDVRGWDKTQYLGIAEFYTEFGNWNASLTVPANYIIASTGTLTNPSDVLTQEQLKRLNSITKDSVSAIITADETASARDSTKNEKRTWKFTAENVRDFAWAASPEYVWDATKTDDGIAIYAFYKAENRRASFPLIIDDATNWDYGATMAKHTIEFYSNQYGPYAYPQATVVSGPVEGMEYPMMVFIENGDAFTNAMNFTIAHELGHEWYPMMIGSNETNYPFMDEGFNTYITAELMEKEFGRNAFLNKDFVKKYSWMNLPDNSDRLFEQRLYLMEAQAKKGASLMSHPYNIPQSEYGIMAYMKPGSALVMLEDVLGKATFNKAMNEYYNRWKFKHPYPHDFFNTIEDIAGRDLDWFWHEWFEETWTLDIALDGIENEKNNGTWKTTLTLKNNEQAKMPATIRLHFADGSTRDVRFSEKIWDRGTIATFVIDSLPARAEEVIVDPDMMLADVNRLNNSSSFPLSFDYGFNLMNKLLYPLDSYRINAAPSVGFNLQDGFELGTSFNGSYSAADHNITAAAAYGTRSDVPDFEISYSTPLRFWDPELTASARAFRLDGFDGWQWSVEKTFEDRKSLARSYSRRFTIAASIISIRVNDVRYLDNPAEWNTKGILNAGFISLRYFENFNWGKFSLQVEDEFGTPASSFNYSKFTVESSLDHPFILGTKLNWRIFSGTAIGTVPAQTAYSLTQATPLERFDNWFFRTPVLGRSTRSHFTKPGGGNIFLSHDTTALQIASLNLSLSRGPLLLFADAGSLWDSSAARFKQFYYDAGAGLQINLGRISLPGYSSGLIGFGVFFPLWVHDPSRQKDEEFDFRWKVVLGVRL